MPHDMHGHELKVGDVVLIPARVKELHATLYHCNLTVDTVVDFYPNASPSQLVLNTKQVELKDAPAPIVEVEEVIEEAEG
jgi:hypothetical protein